MKISASKCKMRVTVLILLALALLLAMPLSVGAEDEGVFASIRLYDGLDPEGMDELYRLTAEGFLDIIRRSDGFIAFYWLHSGERVVSVNLFETEEQASASNEAARDYVTEHLASFVPGPPLIVEGAVSIGFVEMLEDMGSEDVSNLHMSVRLYNGFEADDLDEFVTIVEDGFLPRMRETEGFFGYYLMENGAGTLAAVSIFDTEASAVASNEKARDFVAEYLTAYLPKNPSIVSGQLAIASLAAVDNGANLIDEAPIFVSLRVYDGVDPSDRDEIVRLVNDGFLPIMRESDGFVGYYLLPADEVLAAVSLFDTEEKAAASTAAASGFVAEFMAPLLPNPPLVAEGHVDLMYVITDAGEMMTDDMTALYAALRIYDNYDMSRLPESVALVKSILLPAQHEAGGLFSYISMNDGEDTIAGLSVFDTEENALAANDIAAAFVAEHLADFLPEDPIRVNGRLGVAALAAMRMGENLIGEVMEQQ